MSQLRGKRGEIIHNRMAFEESYTIPSQLIVIFVQGLRFGLVNRGDEGAGAGSATLRGRAAIGNVPSVANLPAPFPSRATTPIPTRGDPVAPPWFRRAPLHGLI